MKTSTLQLKQLRKLIPQRPRDSHKGMFGMVTVIGGQTGMVGAPLLAARAALKLGTGCVHVGLLAEDAPSVDLIQPELMLHKAHVALQLAADSAHHTSNFVIPAQAGIQSDKSTGFPPDRRSIHPEPVEGRERQKIVLAIGCGMGTSLIAHKLLHDALRSAAAVILDADALNILAVRPDLRALLGARQAATVLTPHPGEAARLLACATGDVQQHRLAAADELSRRYHASVVLKGADSVCVTRDGKLYLNKSGNPGMSSAGMGDVLTGMVAAFIAQGMTGDDALLLAVHLHGAAGDELAKQNAMLGMSASEVIEWARWLYNQNASE